MEAIIDLILLGCLYWFVLKPRWQKKGYSIFVVRTLFYLYLISVLCVTLLPIVTTLPTLFSAHYTKVVNLIPFIDLLNPRDWAITQILLNILLTMPFGFLFPMLFSAKHRRFSYTLVATISFSVIIEVLQYVLDNGRISDITDIITNTLGGVIGYFIYKVARASLMTYRKAK